MDLQEKVKRCKSNLRVAKSRYLQVLDKIASTNKRVNREAKLPDSSFSSIIGQPNQYKNLEITSLSVNRLSENYEAVQNSLNKAINNYNSYRRRIHVLLIAKLLNYKKEKYIDEDKIDLINTNIANEKDI